MDRDYINPDPIKKSQYGSDFSKNNNLDANFYNRDEDLTFFPLDPDPAQLKKSILRKKYIYVLCR